ncbi:MAG: hypothetical protein JXO44_04460 [Clostridia bacterium]|nr:hypothetical protein [Clostridia bacterium]
MRHVYSRGLYYAPFIEGVVIQCFLWIIVGITCHCIWRYKTKAIGIGLLTGALIVMYYTNFAKSIMAYPYFLMTIFGCWLLEMIKLKVQ